ncbi:heme A synthase [Arsenicitalea aurantiaca]|uniref:Heme A synthase n=1 Tax=Arsenicitalea aurantiaca TaxID=1783274 RepID=A0A433XEN3_9HYPH|nr:COX15/CtaA family protein [Arsenicitalea aurantiaca]RUT32559.1 heme A synthase [Arsenicitalea aurantiaca]
MASIDTSSSYAFASREDRLRPVRIWLYVMAALVLLMVVVGGATRLTESGLSITSWRPISGTLPPLSQADWEAEFEAYKQIPQYTVLNHWMTLDDFKYIFWWEWAHRFLGRVLGFAFAIPFVIFLVQKRFSRDLAAPLTGLFLLGGFQGVLGWWMVSSGLTELTSVSQYRLAAHLTAASLLLIALIWVARRLEPHAGTMVQPGRPRWLTLGLLVLLILQIAMGAFVAGLDAGMGYNTWPLMDGALIPGGLGAMEPLWRNVFENALTVQFIHRMMAYFIVAYLIFMLWRQARAGGLDGVHGWLPRISLLVIAQVGLGIATLLAAVPISLALGHQVLAFMLAGMTVAYIADMMPGRQKA